jgi:hypothetical protein
MDIGRQLFWANLHSTYPAALPTISTIFRKRVVSGICVAGDTRIRRQLGFYTAAHRLAGGAHKTRLAFFPSCRLSTTVAERERGTEERVRITFTTGWHNLFRQTDSPPSHGISAHNTFSYVKVLVTTQGGGRKGTSR